MILGALGVLVACGRESPRGLPERPSVATAPLLRLLDRNVNMANVLVSLRIDRETGKVDRHVLLDAGCAPSSNDERVYCQAATPKATASAAFPYAWNQDQHTLTGPSERTWAVQEGFYLVRESPDGRWLALRGNQQDYDYLHFNWLLLDLEQGSAFALPDPELTRVGSWLAKVELSESRAPSRERLGARAGDYVTEMPVRFVSANLLLAASKRRARTAVGVRKSSLRVGPARG